MTAAAAASLSAPTTNGSKKIFFLGGLIVKGLQLGTKNKDVLGKCRVGGVGYWLWHQVAVASNGHSHGVGDPGHTLGTPWGNPLTSVCGIKWLWHQVAGVGRCLNVNESSSASSRSGCVSLLDQIRRDVVYGTDVRGFPQSVPRVTYSGPSGSRG